MDYYIRLRNYRHGRCVSVDNYATTAETSGEFPHM